MCVQTGLSLLWFSIELFPARRPPSRSRWGLAPERSGRMGGGMGRGTDRVGVEPARGLVTPTLPATLLTSASFHFPGDAPGAWSPRRGPRYPGSGLAGDPPRPGDRFLLTPPLSPLLSPPPFPPPRAAPPRPAPPAPPAAREAGAR
jgi:hypothetical protein